MNTSTFEKSNETEASEYDIKLRLSLIMQLGFFPKRNSVII